MLKLQQRSCLFTQPKKNSIQSTRGFKIENVQNFVQDLCCFLHYYSYNRWNRHLCLASGTARQRAASSTSTPPSTMRFSRRWRGPKFPRPCLLRWLPPRARYLNSYSMCFGVLCMQLSSWHLLPQNIIDQFNSRSSIRKVCFFSFCTIEA